MQLTIWLCNQYTVYFCWWRALALISLC